MTTDQTAHLQRLKSHLRKGIELAEKATQGPFRECGHDRDGCTCGQIWSVSQDILVANAVYKNEDGEFTPDQVKRNAANIAHACNYHKAHCEAVLEIIEDLEMDLSIETAATERMTANGRLLSILAKYANI